ncbi:MAG: flagellar protein FlbB [bacterium]|nr:flagellar protein FlbB [bacterium]
MAYGSAGSALKIFILLIAIAVLLVGGIVWFDYLGVINRKELLSPITSRFGIETPNELENGSQPVVLDRERLNMQIEALDLRRDELENREKIVKLSEAELIQKQTELAEREKAAIDKEKSLNEALKMYDNKKANLEQNARYLEGMPPEKAVGIMLEMDNLNVIDVLRTSERLALDEGRSSLVSYWLSLMPPDRGASIQKLMAGQPLGN